LIDARNQTLRWATALAAAREGRVLALAEDLSPGLAAELDPPLWTLGHIAWFQEYWIGRNVQRGRGESADPAAVRLASILPDADRGWYDPALVDRRGRREFAGGELPDLQATRDFLVESLETTLELLAGVAAEDDPSLYFHRLALFHEEMHAEDFAVLAQTLGIEEAAALLPRIATHAARPALLFPATRWLLGASAGLRFDNEAAPHPVDIPEFEIDAQAVTWAQYGEFVEDGGYDERKHWGDDGWAWLQRESRRTPRHVDQMRHGVLQRRLGVLARVAALQPAVHVSWHEADAWCRWAGAVCRAKSNGKPPRTRAPRAAFAGATCTSGPRARSGRTGVRARPVARLLAAGLRRPQGPARRLVRDPAGAARARLRGFAPPERDDGFFGFRSCAP
jgi:hypothetical protein